MSETTLTESTLAPGSRLTWIESFSGAVPSHVYTPESNGGFVAVVSVAGALWSEPLLPCPVAEVTPLAPSVVSRSLNGRFAELGPRYAVEPVRIEPAGLPGASWIGSALVSFATDGDEKIESMPALFVTTMR